MKFINMFQDGDNITGIYLCKQRNSAVTKNGKNYDNLTLADKTGQISAKIWDPNSMGIGEFEVNDFIEIHGRVSIFNGMFQLHVDRAFRAREGSFDPRDYIPVSAFPVDEMLNRLKELIGKVSAPYFRSLLDLFFEDPSFVKQFVEHSAAKTVHHSFMGGLLQHTLSVTQTCDFFADHYPVLNRDLLLTAAILHDIGKTRELSSFPLNDYTDEGQLIGHITIGATMVMEKAAQVPGFPERKKNELVHCILAHHGELEYGSPKLPSLIEAFALSFADNIDAKIEVFTEAAESAALEPNGWLGFNKFLNNNIRKTD